MPKDGKTIKIDIDKKWGAGAYVLVNAFRAGKGNEHGPGRAIGLTWLAIDPKPRRLAGFHDRAGNDEAAASGGDPGHGARISPARTPMSPWRRSMKASCN